MHQNDTDSLFIENKINEVVAIVLEFQTFSRRQDSNTNSNLTKTEQANKIKKKRNKVSTKKKGKPSHIKEHHPT